MLRQSGKKLFLATNSLWDYTSVVMNFLLSGRVGSARNCDWLEHFDVVFTGVTQACAQCSQACHVLAGPALAKLWASVRLAC